MLDVNIPLQILFVDSIYNMECVVQLAFIKKCVFKIDIVISIVINIISMKMKLMFI